MNTVEEHPFTPFLPANACLLMLGTFPPAPKRWSMKFYYPNFTNDMWRIFGICFFGDKNHFVISEQKTYDLPAIIDFLNEKGWRYLIRHARWSGLRTRPLTRTS